MRNYLVAQIFYSNFLFFVQVTLQWPLTSNIIKIQQPRLQLFCGVELSNFMTVAPLPFRCLRTRILFEMFFFVDQQAKNDFITVFRNEVIFFDTTFTVLSGLKN